MPDYAWPRIELGHAMAEANRKALRFVVLGTAALLGLSACDSGGGGDGKAAATVKPVSDVQQRAIFIAIRAGSGPGTWVLFQYNDHNQLYDVFTNRRQLPMPASGGHPDIGTVTSDPNNWEPYGQNTAMVLGTTTTLSLDSGSTPNTFTTTPQALADFVTKNPNLAQTAWNEIGQK